MKTKPVTFTCRMPRDVVDQIDQACLKYGYATRAKFLAAAGLTYGSQPGDELLLSRLSEIAFALHRLAAAETLPPGALSELKREVRSAMKALRDAAG